MAVEVIIPSLGDVVNEVTITEWFKKEGDSIEKGEVLLLVESEKVNTEIEAPSSGIIGKILYPEGAKVAITAVVSIIVAEGEDVPEKYLRNIIDSPTKGERPGEQQKINGEKAFKGRVAPAARKLAQLKSIDLSEVIPTGPHETIMKKDIKAYLTALESQTKDDSVKNIEKDTHEEAAVKSSSLARHLAAKEEVALNEVKGSGVRSRVMRADVERFIQQKKATDLAKTEVIKLNGKRQVIARRMSESAFTAPHVYFFSEVCMDPIIKYRQKILHLYQSNFGIRISINDLLIKAVALNLLDYPLLNAQIVGQEIHLLPEINIGLAVALDDGLIVPAVSNADKTGLKQIAEQRMDLVQRAKSGELKLEEIRRGTFTISSLAQFDIICFTAIINPPQSGILSVGKTVESLYMEEKTVKMKRVSTFGLSVDHRIIDGAVAAEFLQNLKKKIENPEFTFMHI